MVITNSSTANSVSVDSSDKRGYNLFLLVVRGWAACSTGWTSASSAARCPIWRHLALNTAELSVIVAAMMLGGVVSTLFAGCLPSGWDASR